MKQRNGSIMAAIVWIISCNCVQAQSSRLQDIKPVADSSQRVWMRQYLKINDDLITRVFVIRDSMYDQVNRIRSDKSLSIDVQDSSVLAVRKQAEEKIRATLSDKVYYLYVAAIRQRLQGRGRGTESPLTGSVN